MSLQEVEKEAFNMCAFGGMNSYEIANRLQIDHAAVKGFLEALFARVPTRELEQLYVQALNNS